MIKQFSKIVIVVVLGAIIFGGLFIVKKKPIATPIPTIKIPTSTILHSPSETTNNTDSSSTPKPIILPPKPTTITKSVTNTPPVAKPPVTTPVTPSHTPQVSAGSPLLGGCTIFPTTNPWNQDVSQLPVLTKSATYINSIGAAKKLHPDFGEDPSYGIPITIVPSSQPNVSINFTDYGDESDPGPYPIPSNAKVEAGSDAHVLVLQSGACKLYELYGAEKNNNGGWDAASGAVFNLGSNALRPLGWTSADAAGLPILPGLVRYDEIAAGVIKHAIRVTVPRSQNGHILPATHEAGSKNTDLPPMGLRLRLKADYDISNFSGQAKIILVAMKKYGLIIADNGSAWFFQGATDSRWNDNELNQLKQVPGSAFEAVDTGAIQF